MVYMITNRIYISSTIFCQEIIIQTNMNTTTTFCQFHNQFITHISRMITQNLCRSMRCYNWLITKFYCLFNSRICCMRHIYHHTQTIHLTNHLTTKIRQSAVRSFASSRITQIIISIMTECNITHSHIIKFLYITNISRQRKPIL